jgi:hypothetical protein
MYSINNLFEDIKLRIKKINKTDIQRVKEKEMKILLKNLDVLKESIEKFGEEEVWSYLERGETEFDEILKKIN